MEHQEAAHAGHSIHRTPEESRAIRRKILMVTLLLSVVTIVEVVIGIFYSQSHVGPMTWQLIKWMYIILTLVKAGYIVMIFMHLGDEQKNLRVTILLPIVFLIYFIFIMLYEGTAIIQYLETIFK